MESRLLVNAWNESQGFVDGMNSVGPNPPNRTKKYHQVRKDTKMNQKSDCWRMHENESQGFVGSIPQQALSHASESKTRPVPS